MTEEPPVDNVESVEEHRKQTEQPKPWSAPGTTESVHEAEPPTYEPLQPLSPTVAETIADTLTPEVPSFDELIQEFTQPQVPSVDAPRILRPVSGLSAETCPENFLGFCVTCSIMPCNYMIGRVLRHLLSKVQ
jgi:hypothetical protein